MPPQSLLPHLTTLDGSTVTIACVFAVVMSILRRLHGIQDAKGQLITDALSLWTVIILLMIAASFFTATVPFINVPLPSAEQLFHDNGVMMPIVFMYCAVMIFNNMVQGVLEAWGNGFSGMYTWCVQVIRVRVGR